MPSRVIVSQTTQVRPLHLKDNTFPGEVLMHLAVEALALGG